MVSEWVFPVTQNSTSIAAAQSPANAANNAVAAHIATGELAFDTVHLNPGTLACMGAGQPESQVNGVWIWILQQYFPFGTFIVAPEYSGTGTGRGDAVVVATADARPVFGYEGKKALSATQQWNSSNQLTQYVKAISSAYGYGFGVYSSGTQFSVRRHINGGTNTDVVSSDLKQTTQGDYYRLKTATSEAMLNLTDVADVGEAKRIFRAIITKQWTQ